jgi:hypothetical protein
MAAWSKAAAGVILAGCTLAVVWALVYGHPARGPEPRQDGVPNPARAEAAPGIANGEAAARPRAAVPAAATVKAGAAPLAKDPVQRITTREYEARRQVLVAAFEQQRAAAAEQRAKEQAAADEESQGPADEKRDPASNPSPPPPHAGGGPPADPTRR